MLDPDDPDSDTDQTAYLYHNEPYTMTYAGSSGHVLTANDYLFFVPASSSACPAVAPALSGGFLGSSGQMTVQLSAASSPYVMCVREGLLNTDPIYMHRHLTAVVSYRAPTPPPPPDGTCNPTSEITATVSKMNEHPNFGGTHMAVGVKEPTSAQFNGCVASCGSGCRTNNPDIADNAPIYYCDTNDETSTALDYPRCAHACTTAGLQTSCVGLCAVGTYCCASTGTSH